MPTFGASRWTLLVPPNTPLLVLLTRAAHTPRSLFQDDLRSRTALNLPLAVASVLHRDPATPQGLNPFAPVMPLLESTPPSWMCGGVPPLLSSHVLCRYPAVHGCGASRFPISPQGGWVGFLLRPDETCVPVELVRAYLCFESCCAATYTGHVADRLWSPMCLSCNSSLARA